MANSKIKVMSSGGLKAVIMALAGAFEGASGHHLVPVFAPPATVKSRIESGEAVDVAVLAANLIDDLARQGKVRPGTALARSRLGLAVRAGAPKPDIGTVAALRRVLLDAATIVVTDPAGGGASGIHFKTMIEELGIAEALRPKLKLNSGSYNAELVARGEAELAIQQISEIVPVEGAELVGPLPADVQLTTVFKAAIGADAAHPEEAKAFIAFLGSPTATAVIEAGGMQMP